MFLARYVKHHCFGLIPMKNMFDGAPVSRSQAKRLSHRFEEFQEVILHFNGLDWIGQGFADQLFRVFAKAHPEIKILPENMNEDIRRMVQHVGSRVSPAGEP